MKRSAALKRSPISRKTPVKRVNVQRRRLEFARAYGSQERVIWIQSLACYGCGAIGRSENAHTANGGTSRKADANTIIPLCHRDHLAFDGYSTPFDNEAARERARSFAAVIDLNWNMKQTSARMSATGT